MSRPASVQRREALRILGWAAASAWAPSAQAQEKPKKPDKSKRPKIEIHKLWLPL